MDRPGIHPSWLKQNDPGKKLTTHFRPEQVAESAERLRFFAQCPDTGEIYRQTKPGTVPAPEDAWWSWLTSPIDRYGMHALDHFQLRTVANGSWDHELASRVADAFELRSLLYLRGRLRAYQAGEKFHLFVVHPDTYALVLMLVEGESERALRWADALVSATRWAQYQSMAAMFTSNFILELLADSLGREPRPIAMPRMRAGAFDPRPQFAGIIASWKTPDPAEAGALLLRACDIHTQLAWSGTRFHEREFTNGFWMRTPLAALLIMKLRESRGLPNPEIDHAIMASPLGRLPRPGYVPDPLIASLRERLERDGVDLAGVPAAFRGDALPARP